MGIRLQVLMQSLTLVEESAIHQVTPMLHIVKLSHGNYGTTGNTSMVWQRSKLNIILPNLPATCKYICIKRASQRQQRGNTQMVQTKFERAKIGEALDLLSKTMDGVWNNNTLSQEYLEAWPLVGDILDLNETPTIIQTDTNDIEQSPNLLPPGNIVEQLVGDGDDVGPTPLQNAVQPSEVYEVVVDLLNTSSSSSTNATSAINELHDIAEILREQNNSQVTPVNNIPIPVMTHNQTTANFNQFEVVA